MPNKPLEFLSPSGYVTIEATFISPDRKKEIKTSALIDTGAAWISLPESMCKELQLESFGWTTIVLADGTFHRAQVSCVIFKINGKERFLPCIVFGIVPLIGIIGIELFGELLGLVK